MSTLNGPMVSLILTAAHRSPEDLAQNNGDNGKENGNYYLGFRVIGFRLWTLRSRTLFKFQTPRPQTRNCQTLSPMGSRSLDPTP